VEEVEVLVVVVVVVVVEGPALRQTPANIANKAVKNKTGATVLASFVPVVV